MRMWTSFAPALRRFITRDARGGAAHDGVVDDDDALARDAFLDDVELHLHAEFARELRGIEEGAPDVMVADEGRVVGDARFLAEAERGVVAGVGHGDDEVGLDGVEAGQFAAHVRAHRADVDALERAVGPREIDVLEDAEAELVLRHEGLDRAQAVFVDDDDFARLDVADELRAGDDVEGAAFAREQPRAVDLADAERTEAERVAHADDFALAHQDEGKGALHLAERLDEDAVAEAVGRLGHEVEDDLAVDRGLEDGALGFQFVAQEVGVDQVAVVADGDLAARAIDDDGLGVFERAGAGGGIADVADGARAGQLGEFVRR